MKKTIYLILFVFMISTLPAVCLQAQTASVDQNLEITQTEADCGVCETAESKSFAKSAPGKLGRGAVNILLGWTNLFAQPINVGTSGGNVLNGIGTGFVETFTRTVQGVVELGLFWLPPAHGEPLNRCALGDLGVTGR